MTEIKQIEKKENGICFFEMKNDNIRVITTNLGCHILSIFTKDRAGQEADILLGFENVEDCEKDGSYMGALVGRVANRIADAKFQLNGETYELAANNGKNHLHGGLHGWNQKLFQYEQLEDGIRFCYVSPDMEEGYPGRVLLKVSYRLKEEGLEMEYEAVSDQDTIVNITNHPYFNLSGGQDKIYHHQLRMKADQIACVDENCCANGEFLDVAGTPFDFRDFHEIGERIHEDHEQIRYAGGYDHSYLVSEAADQAVLYDPKSGRKLIVSTTLPCIQVYTANFLAGGCNGKHGKPYENRDGVALEAQFLPNSIHIEKEPRVILRKGEQYHAVTSYRFEVE